MWGEFPYVLSPSRMSLFSLALLICQQFISYMYVHICLCQRMIVQFLGSLSIGRNEVVTKYWFPLQITTQIGIVGTHLIPTYWLHNFLEKSIISCAPSQLLSELLYNTLQQDNYTYKECTLLYSEVNLVMKEMRQDLTNEISFRLFPLTELQLNIVL